MLLESLDKMNIKNLSIEEPEKQEELPFDPEKEITAKDWQDMKKQLEETRNVSAWWGFSRKAMEMKIFFPEKASELNVDDRAWQGMKKDMEEDRNRKDWGRFSWQVMNMKILSAEEARITDQGLEIIMRKAKPEFKKETPPLPETRKF